jgi:hypothetical protein
MVTIQGQGNGIEMPPAACSINLNRRGRRPSIQRYNIDEFDSKDLT